MIDINMYQVMFEKYIDDKIDETHFDKFVESLSSPIFLGCKVNLISSKVEKKVNPKKETVENINRAIGIYNSNLAMKKRLDDELADSVFQILQLEDNKDSSSVWKYIKIKMIDSSIKDSQYVIFTCYAEPTAIFYKTLAEKKLIKNVGKVSFIITAKVPLVSDAINDNYLNSEFCSVSVKKKK